jgi:hypothetical protein
MGELCPPWKFRATTFTPKVLYYMPDLMPGTIIYTDDIDLSDNNGVIPTIKKMTADFENPTVIDTVIDGKAATRSIPERMEVWLSSVDAITDVQLGTRFIISSTESGSEHDHEVNHKQKGRCLGAVPEDSNEKVLICRCMLEYICNNLYNVFSAYGFVSDWSEESEKRNQEKFLDVLLAVTVFNYRQRETVRENLIGTLDDWKRAVSIYSPVAQNNSSMLTDEEILLLYSVFKMCKLFDYGVPHKRVFAYNKETGIFKKSESSLKRILLGDAKSGKQGFKEKVPGFTFEKVEMTKLDENGLEVKGGGKTRALCYYYDGDLFDGLPEGAEGMDVVNAIKSRSFVSCDYNTAKALELAFKEDPSEVYKLKDNSQKLETWKKSLRNQNHPSEIIRNPQNSNALISEKTNCKMPNNNNKISNNNLRIHEMGKRGGIEKNIFSASFPSSSQEETKKNIFLPPLKTVNSVNSVISEASASDHGLNSENSVLISEANASDYDLNSEDFESNHILNSEATDSDLNFNAKTLLVNSEKLDVNSETSEIKIPVNSMISVISEPLSSDHCLNSEDSVLNSEPPAGDCALNSEKVEENSKTSELNLPVNSDLTGLLRRALVKLARDEYKGIVRDRDEFIRRFNTKVSEYVKALGVDVVAYNAKTLHMRGWRM